ncbi:type II toxin-antitoxin system RelE/ParE family toxin [Cognatishimia sp. SS12]|uniref:type II toxin-antitoxin system RelE/ParE family toxin n=1 Tax=Cognatishimia sp. SS12 TaxID=2979465 RepID=UPI00232C9990|nr:type II toxin-antitoxin system RelE/ParE family toxin [Cognatishimia sp. SS12]MDC0738493.1 type II toxin-antitoxin system RelE/ParE family toxin [Cognatishimia sp. SS12]
MSIRKKSKPDLKPCRWVGSSQKDMRAFPTAVRKEMGTALMYAQGGGRAGNVKTLSGMGSGVLEVVDDHDGDTYRCVYLLRLKGVVYILHAFQKKSKSGIKTPPQDKKLIKSRIKLAENDYEEFKKEIEE